MLGQGRRPGARAGGARPRRLRRDRGELRRARADPPQGRAGGPSQRGGARGRARADRAAARGGRGVRAARARAGARARARPRRAAAARPGSPATSSATRARSPGRWPRSPGSRVRTHTRVDDLGALRADHVVLAAGPWSAALARTAGLHLPLEPRKGQLVRLAGRMDIRHKVVDGGYLAAVAAPDAALQISTVLETTFDGHVLVGSSRERKGFDTSVDPAVTERLLQSAAALMPRVAALRPRPRGPACARGCPTACPRSAARRRPLGRHRPRGRRRRARADQRRAARRRDQRRDAAA